MGKIEIPGMIDAHVHMRVPGGEQKETWQSGSAAALAGGITSLLAMPNTKPPIINKRRLSEGLKVANQEAYCDFGQFVAGTDTNAIDLVKTATDAIGIKMYLDSTYGELKLTDIGAYINIINNSTIDLPIAVHAEKTSLAAIILIGHLYNRSIHICHVSRREEILMIRKAKEKGVQVTCEVTPHHLFLTEDDLSHLSQGFKEVRPALGTKSDVNALWENLDVIDVFATDHAPHTVEEKRSETPPPGFPGLETALPLLFTAVNDGRLTLEDVILRYQINPKKIFRIPDQLETIVTVDMNTKYTVNAEHMFSKGKWSPFDGMQLSTRIETVTSRGKLAYQNGEILVPKGYGKQISSSR